MILLIDNYDSFVYNLYQFIGINMEKQKTKEIKVIRNDKTTIHEIKKLKPGKILLSPGPGKPSNAGICQEIIENFYKTTPILGICLGHQVICETFGGKVSYADKIMHGKTSKIIIKKNEDPLFKNIPKEINVGRYHSLALMKNTLPEDLEILCETKTNEIMGVKHKKYPTYGLQFHPESILTEKGLEIIENFIKI